MSENVVFRQKHIQNLVYNDSAAIHIKFEMEIKFYTLKKILLERGIMEYPKLTYSVST